MKRLLSALLAAALLLAAAACAAPEATAPEGYALYYLVDTETHQGGDAVAAEYCPLELPEEPAKAAEALLERYWQGPESEELLSPLPSGLQLLSVEVENGRLTLDVSGQYGTLSGVELTLADSCLTLTLTQLSGIYSVTVLVRGRALEYRAEQELWRRDLLLSTSEDLVGTVRATLWYEDAETGEPVSVVQTIPVYEGKTRAESVLDALRQPPVDTWRSLLPEEFAFISVQLEEDVCYVNLPAVALELLEGDEERLLTAAARSLCSLSSVSAVRYLVDGDSAVWYGEAPVDELYTGE